jgi:hypothetical protein
MTLKYNMATSTESLTQTVGLLARLPKLTGEPQGNVLPHISHRVMALRNLIARNEYVSNRKNKFTESTN